MGKLSYEPFIRHFSHDHPLELSNLQNQTSNLASSCSACKAKPIGGIYYTCSPCNYFLHISCSQMPQLIRHPADQNHPLALVARPAYPEGRFNCDACGAQGDGFCYHCAACGLDFHILCASKPLVLNHPSHKPHPLKPAFFPPYETKRFSCDICYKLGSNHWLYRCDECEFDAHLVCATAVLRGEVENQIQLLQTQLLQCNYSFPGADRPCFQPPGPVEVQEINQQWCHVNSMSLGVPQTGQPAQNGVGVVGQAVQPGYMSVAYTGQPAQNSLSGSTLVSAAVQGLVEGAAQQVGQSLMQSILGDSNSSG